MESIIHEIFKNADFNKDQLDNLGDKLKKARLTKGEFLLKPDKEVNELFYVHTGCLRNYFIDAQGKEHTLQFAIKGWWISDYIALYGKGNTKSVSYIECIKDTTVYKLSKNDFDQLYKETPRLAHFHIEKLEYAFASFQNRILENLTLSAKDRYIKFRNTYPDIEQNVKNYHIASYLGITTESLSRIRKEITS